MVRETARAYCQEKLAPRVLGAFRSEHEDVGTIYRELGALDMLGVTIPEQYGGAGLGYVSYGLVAREVERVDSGYRSMMSVQASLVMTPINEFGTTEQKERFIPRLAAGEWIGDRLPDERGRRGLLVGAALYVGAALVHRVERTFGRRRRVGEDGVE